MLQKYKIIYNIFCLVIFASFLLASFQLAQAADKPDIGTAAIGGVTKTGSAAQYSTDVPIDAALISIVNFLLTFIGIVFLGLMLYGGWLWMIARGEEEKITKARKIITEAVFGLVIILMARLFTEFLIVQLGTAADTPK